MGNRAGRQAVQGNAGGVLNGHGLVIATGADDDIGTRLDRIEAVQRELVAAEREREAARVRRKVVASSTGAGVAGVVPLLLQLADALAVSAQVAATMSTAVAAVGALLAGYLTPERMPALPPAPGPAASASE
jgi:hypothetical protein